MIVWTVSFDLNFSPNIWRLPFVCAFKDPRNHKKLNDKTKQEGEDNEDE
jgi:hypothetical protein